MDILELKNTITSNFKIQWVHSTAEQKGGEKRSHELTDRTIEVSQSEQQRENRLGGKKNGQSLRDL